MNVSEKAAYLKGMVDGSDLSFSDKEKKVFDACMDLLSSMAARITEMDEELSELYNDFDLICDGFDDMASDIDCLFGLGGDDEDLEALEDDVLYDVECPKCKEMICIDEDILLQGDINCPGCGEKLEFDVGCDCEKCRDKQGEE